MNVGSPARARASLADLGVLLVCAALAVIVVVLHVRAFTQVSPIDELQHLDYLDKAPSGHVVARGERIGQTALREEACHGVDATVDDLPGCLDPAPLDPDRFQEFGYNTASVHPPTYYAATGALAKALRSATGVDSLLTAGRAVGALWLVLGVAVLWGVLRRAGADPLTQFALLTLVIVSPAVVAASSTVGPDATGLFAGALVLAAVLAWESGRVGTWAPAAAVAVALGLKFTHIGALGVAIVYVVARAAQQADLRRWREEQVVRRAGVVLAAMVGVAFAMVAVWSVVQAVLAKMPQADLPMAAAVRGRGLPFARLAGDVTATLSPLRDPYYSPVLRRSPVSMDDPATSVGAAVTHVVDALALVGVASAAVFARVRSQGRAVALAASVAMVTLGPVVMLSSFVTTRTVAATPARYGLPVMPAVVLAALPAMQHRVLRNAVAAVAVVVAAVMLQRLAAG